MSAFEPDAEFDGDVAYRLLSRSPVTLFFRRDALETTTTWLRQQNYQLVELSAETWTPTTMLGDIAAALDFPDYFGGNLDALNDCLRDVVDQDYGWDPASTGLVLVISRFDALAARDARIAHALLDIVAAHSRSAALLGRRLLCLVQSDDPRIAVPPVGASPVQWNDAEWRDTDRRTE